MYVLRKLFLPAGLFVFCHVFGHTTSTSYTCTHSQQELSIYINLHERHDYNSVILARVNSVLISTMNSLRIIDLPDTYTVVAYDPQDDKFFISLSLDKLHFRDGRHVVEGYFAANATINSHGTLNKYRLDCHAIAASQSSGSKLPGDNTP